MRPTDSPTDRQVLFNEEIHVFRWSHGARWRHYIRPLGVSKYPFDSQHRFIGGMSGAEVQDWIESRWRPPIDEEAKAFALGSLRRFYTEGELPKEGEGEKGNGS